MTARAACLGALAGTDIDLDRIDGCAQLGPGEDKAGEMMTSVEQAGQQHGRSQRWQIDGQDIALGQKIVEFLIWSWS